MLASQLGLDFDMHLAQKFIARSDRSKQTESTRYVSIDKHGISLFFQYVDFLCETDTFVLRGIESSISCCVKWYLCHVVCILSIFSPILCLHSYPLRSSVMLPSPSKYPRWRFVYLLECFLYSARNLAVISRCDVAIVMSCT